MSKNRLSFKEMLSNNFFKKLKSMVKKFGAIDIRRQR